MTRIRLRLIPAGASHYYRKVETRAAQAIAKVGLAAVLHRNAEGRTGSARLAFSSVAATPKLTTVLALLSSRERSRKILGWSASEYYWRRILCRNRIFALALRYRMEIAACLVWEALQAPLAENEKE